MSAEFVDSNIHVYARDAHAGEKRVIAQELVERLWREGSGATSVQVLCEFYAVVTRKIREPLEMERALRVVRNLSQWRVHEPGAAHVERAARRAARSKLSFWDAMIVESAIALGCAVLWSEDLQDGAVYEGVRVRNPFRQARG